MALLKLAALLLLICGSMQADQCPKASWVIEDDRVDGIIAVEGRPVTHALVRVSSPVRNYSAVTDSAGRFLVPKVPVGGYALFVKGWGKAHLDVKGWHRGASIAQCFSSTQLGVVFFFYRSPTDSRSHRGFLRMEKI